VYQRGGVRLRLHLKRPHVAHRSLRAVYAALVGECDDLLSSISPDIGLVRFPIQVRRRCYGSE
jgi:hypothetical protein